MDLEFAYGIGDMVRFILTKNHDKILTGFITERWITKTQDPKYPKVKLYKILSLNHNLLAFTVIEELVVEKA